MSKTFNYNTTKIKNPSTGEWENMNSVTLKGKSAYEYAVEGGYEGTEEEFTEKLAKEYVGQDDFKTLQSSVGALNSKISGKMLHGKITVNINAVGYVTFPEIFDTTPSVFLTANDHTGSVLVTPYDISSDGITLITRNIDNEYPYSTVEIEWLAIG